MRHVSRSSRHHTERRVWYAASKRNAKGPTPVAGSRLIGIPHTPGTREYLVCESGQLVLVASGERYELEPGDVVVFRGGQRHSCENPGKKPAVGYSAVLPTPARG